MHSCTSGGRTPTTLHPLSSLTSLTHLAVCEYQHTGLLGIEDVAPHLRNLRSVALPDFRSPPVPQLLALAFVESIQLHHVIGTALNELLGALSEAAASGQSRIRQLKIRELDLNWGPDVLHNAGEVGAAASMHAAALPHLALSVLQVEAPSFLPLFQFFLHPPLAHCASDIHSVRIDLSLVPANMAQELTILRGDITRLELLCPHLRGTIFTLSFEPI